MSVMAINCPIARELVSTGIEADSFSFEMLPTILTRSHCDAFAKFIRASD